MYWWRNPENAAGEIYERLNRWARVDAALQSDMVRQHMIGESRTWTATLRELVEIALFSSSPCLIEGESGTGKELAARLIHTLDPREDKRDLVVVDCSTIVPELSGSEFFGHERGAYTGAAGNRDGAFALADGGTLFLDEAGELPPALQAQLLRVIQEGTYKRVGGNEWRKTSFRLVCATNRQLAAEVERGRFRADLYYRITGAIVRLPSLRERRADLIPLVRHFVAEIMPDNRVAALDPAVEAWLSTREYPGNVRELRQVVTRMCRRHAGPGPLTPGDIAIEDRPRARTAADWRGEPMEQVVRQAVLEGAGLKEIGKQAAACAIRVALESSDGNLRSASRKLGVTGRALQIRRASERERGERPGSRPDVNGAE
ncbi:MAG: sigma-54-dependent Fis family transcriptional regulator [Terriglobia bacterium]|nr:MAG: sigma-54-dependent Fis family transcriptional regulator [Terriglobia bacterium]